MHALKHTCTPALKHTCTHAHTCPCMYACMHVCAGLRTAPRRVSSRSPRALSEGQIGTHVRPVEATETETAATPRAAVTSSDTCDECLSGRYSDV